MTLRSGHPLPSPLMGLLRATDPARLRHAPLTYEAVGTARSGAVPAGFRGLAQPTHRASTVVFDTLEHALRDPMGSLCNGQAQFT